MIQLARWILPDACLLCDRPAGRTPNLCTACAAALPRITGDGGHRVVALAYEPPVSTLIQWMKFEARLPAASTLGAVLAEAVTAQPTGSPLPAAIVPVPLHRSRMRMRGFNQSVEIARPIARRLGLPLLTRICERTRATAPQSGLPSHAARRRNVAGAFRVRTRVTDLERIAIVDDVLTTGATVAALARALRTAGVRHVHVWACAGRVA